MLWVSVNSAAAIINMFSDSLSTTVEVWMCFVLLLPAHIVCGKLMFSFVSVCRSVSLSVQREWVPIWPLPMMPWKPPPPTTTWTCSIIFTFAGPINSSQWPQWPSTNNNKSWILSTEFMRDRAKSLLVEFLFLTDYLWSFVPLHTFLWRVLRGARFYFSYVTYCHQWHSFAQLSLLGNE